MNRMSRLAVALSLGSTLSLAQSSPREMPFIPLETHCPIDIRATLEKSGNMAGAQRLQITLNKWPSFAITAARITVHGISRAANHPEPAEITESLDLTRIVDHPRPSVSPVNVTHASTQNEMPWLPPPGEPVIVRVHSPDSRWYAWVFGFTAVQSIDLDSVNYADGTNWYAANGKPCRVAVSTSVW
jgi:hypothetical protein